jgi:hypothetical protein
MTERKSEGARPLSISTNSGVLGEFGVKTGRL